MAAMATPVCRNGCFILPPQLSPYPGHLQSFVFPWPLEKKPYCRLGFHSKPSPAAASISGTTPPHFSTHTYDHRRSARGSAHTVLLDKEEKKETFTLPSLPYNANSSLSVESWGSFYTGPFESKYWNSNRHFPYTVGYTSIKSYKGKQYLQTIEEGPGGPLFLVEVIGESKSFSSKSPQKVWNDVVEEDGQNVQGARHFGFQSPDVIKALQALPRLQKCGRKEEAFSAREPEVHDNSLSSIDEGQVSDTIQSDRDRVSAQVEMLFEEDSEDDDLGDEEMVQEEDDDDDDDDEVAAAAEVHEEEEEEEDDEEEDDDDDDDDDDEVAAAAEVHEEEEEEEEEEEDDVIEDDVLHDDHDVGDSHDLETDDDDDEDEEDDNERDPLSYNVYSSKRRVHADDDSPGFDDTGPLLNNFKQSFRSTHTGSSFDRFDSADEPYKEDIGVASNDVYYPSEHGRSKVVGRVWRKGDSLAGHSVGYGKQHGAERPGGDQRSLSNEGAQPRASTALSFNGSRSWDGSFTRKREENTKSSQMLLELLQKWNKAKRWNREPGASVRARSESKNLQSREDNEQHQDVSWGDESAFMTSNGRVSETNPIALKGNLNLRSYEGQEPIQSSPFSSESNEFVSDEFNDVDESTDYAISKLFETVGKRETLFSGVQSPPSLGKLLADSSRMVNHVEKSWSSGAISRPTETVDCQQTRLESGEGAKRTREVDREGSHVLNLADKRVGNVDISAAVKMKDLGSESTQLIGRGVPMLAKKQVEEIRLIESVRKLVGSKRYEDALLAVKSAKASNLDLQVDAYEALLGDVKLEAWQKQVFTHVQDGNSVLVSAPSGAGKSTAAECCLFRNFIEENRTLFVTPSEHLAKEKLHMLGSIFGHRNIGGTGTRTRTQKDHKVVVLTLETLAKMLQELNGPGGSEFRFFFEGINMVVLDKLHTFSEAKYGNMWEEVFMLMDARIKVLALTLPANNEDQIVSWIGMNRGPCKLVSSRVEPVLKRYLFCHGSGFFPLLDAKGVQLNDALLESSGGFKNSMTKEQLESFFLSGYDKPSLKQALSLLADNAMLPAFVVFFNIKGCEDAMQDVFAALGEGLLSKQELAKLEAHWNELGETHPDLLKHLEQADREALCKGFAACHEGKLPAWQTFVLKLFQENILKLLIVTENILFHTEAVARTIILPATCKVMKDGVLPIRSVQALPLFGFAGRRGYDIEGNVVFLRNFNSGPREAASLVLKNDLDIVSSFKPSYSLVVNLMAKYKLSKVKQLLGSTLHDVYNTHAKDKKLEEVDRKILDCLESKADFEVKLFQGLAEVNKQKLADAAVFTRVDIRMTIHSASHNGNAFPGFLLAVVPDQAESFYMVFGADNNFRLVPAGALDHVYTVESPTLDVLYKQLTGQPLQPPAIPPKESWTVEHDGTGGYIARGDSQTRQYVKLLMDYPVQVNVDKEGLQLRKEILLLDTQISNLIEKRRSLQVGKQIGEAKLAGSTEVINGGALELDDSDTWTEAIRLLNILEHVDALSLTESQGAHVKLKPLGMLISRLHNVDNELWLALVLTLSHVKQLPPGEFMAIIAATVPLETEVENLFNDQRDLLYRATRPLKEAFTMLEVLRKQVAALQGSYTPPLHFCTTFAGMVYAWARGKPGTVGFNLENTNDGEVAWKLKSVVRYANLISRACSQVSVDISEPNDFSSLSMLARKAEESLSRHLVAVDRNI